MGPFRGVFLVRRGNVARALHILSFLLPFLGSHSSTSSWAQNRHSGNAGIGSGESELRSCRDQLNSKDRAIRLLSMTAGKSGPNQKALSDIGVLDSDCFDSKVPFFAACARAHHPESSFLSPQGALRGGARPRFPGDEVLKAKVKGQVYFFVPTRSKDGLNTSIRVCSKLPCDSASIVAWMNDYGAVDPNGKKLREADGIIDQVHLVGQIQMKGSTANTSGVVKLPLNQDRLTTVLTDNERSEVAKNFRETQRIGTLKTMGFDALVSESTPGTMCRGKQGDPAKLFAYIMDTTGWNPKKTQFTWWHSTRAFGASFAELDTYANSGEGLVGLGQGLVSGTAGVTKAIFYHIPKAGWKLASDRETQKAFGAAVAKLGPLWTQMQNECRELAQRKLGLRASPALEFATYQCANTKLLLKGGAALLGPLKKCFELNPTKEGAREAGKCVGEATVVAVTAALTGGAIAAARTGATRAATITTRAMQAGRLTPARQAVLTKARLKARASLVGLTAANEIYGLGGTGRNPMKNADQAIERITNNLDALVEKGVIKESLSEAQVEDLSKYLYQVAQHSAAASRGPPPIPPASLKGVFDPGRLESYVSEVATLTAPPKTVADRRASEGNAFKYEGSASLLAKEIADGKGTEGAHRLGAEARKMPANRREQFVKEMKAAQAHEKSVLDSVAAKSAATTNPQLKRELTSQRLQLVLRQQHFREAWQIADGTLKTDAEMLADSASLVTAGSRNTETPIRASARAETNNRVESTGGGNGRSNGHAVATLSEPSIGLEQAGRAEFEPQGPTDFFRRRQSDPSNTPDIRESLNHQSDLNSGIKTLSPESRRSLGLDDQQFENLRQAEKISDFGKLPEGKALLKPSGDAAITADSDMLINALSGRADPRVARSQAAIREVLDEAGHKGKWLLPSNLSPAQTRSVVGDAPVLLGYLHEFPGNLEIIKQFERGVITKAQFKARLQGNMFHNGPDEGFWHLMSSTFVPGGLKKASSTNPHAEKFFEGTVFDAGRGKIKTPPPQNLGLIHTVYDRLSQGTGGGMVKIMRELEPSPMKGSEILKSLAGNNGANTLRQFRELERILSVDKTLSAEAKRTLRGMIESAKGRTAVFNADMARRIKLGADEVTIDGVRYTNDQRSEMLTAFERVSRDIEGRINPVARLDQPQNTPVPHLDRQGNPLTEEQYNNGLLIPSERRTAIRDSYAKAGINLNPVDLDVLMGVHNKGNPTGWQDLGSLKDKLGSLGPDDPGYRNHFMRKFSSPQKYREFRRVTKDAMDRGLLGSLAEPPAAAVAPKSAALNLPAAPKIDASLKPDKKSIEIAKQATQSDKATRVSFPNSTPTDHRFHLTKGGGDLTDWTLSEAADGYLIVKRQGRDVFMGKEPRAAIYNPDLAAELKRLRELEAAIKKPGDLTATERMKAAHAALQERVGRKVQEAFRDQVPEAFEGRVLPRGELSPDFIVRDAKGNVDYSRMPSREMVAMVEEAAATSKRFSFKDASRISKTDFRVQDHTNNATDWTFRDLGDGKVSVQMHGKNISMGKEPQMMIENAALAADLKSFLTLQNKMGRSAAETVEMNLMRDKIVGQMPEVFNQQVSPSLRGEIKISASVQSAPPSASAGPMATRSIAGEADFPTELKEWSALGPEDSTEWAKESVRSRFNRKPHELFDVLEHRAPEKPGLPLKPRAGVPGKYARPGSAASRALSARLQQLDGFVEDFAIQSQGGKLPVVNPKLEYKLDARTDFLSFGKVNANKISEGITIFVGNESSIPFARIEFSLPDGRGGSKSLQMISTDEELKIVKDILLKAKSTNAIERDSALVRLFRLGQEKARAARASLGN